MSSEQRVFIEAARHVEKALNELNKAFDVEGLDSKIHSALTEQAFQLNKILDDITANIIEE